MKKEAGNWLRSAKNDLETARYNLQGDRLDAAAFYAQQAAEKSLKSLQIERLQRTHDLVLLGKPVNAPQEIVGLCEMIEPFYTVTRYPDSAVDYDTETVRLVLEASEKWSRGHEAD